MLDKVVHNNQESSVPLVDRLPFFDVTISSITVAEYSTTKSLVTINNNINVLVLSGLTGVLTKRDSFKLYYQPSDSGYPDVIIMLRK